MNGGVSPLQIKNVINEIFIVNREKQKKSIKLKWFAKKNVANPSSNLNLTIV
jgi:hypothetical protein